MFYINRVIALASCALFTFPAFALESLTDDQLSSSTGQAGAEIDLTLKINVDDSNNYNCEANTTFCRIAFSPNNRSEWIVLKGFRGSISLQGVRLDGAIDISGLGRNGIKLTFDPSKPIEIRNLGFDALSIEQDFTAGTYTPTQGANGYTEELNSGEGYLAPGYYGDFSSSPDPNGVSGYNNAAFYNVQAFDQGRERGFIGVTMNGNLSVDGSLTIFNFQP